MEVVLLGTGDTTGTPTPGCNCETCDLARERGVERSRFSVYIRNERRDAGLLIDASPDFRHQFLNRDVPLPDACLITHIHFDHLDGLGNVYRLLDDFPVHAVGTVDRTTGESVADTIRRKYAYLDRITVIDETPYHAFSVIGLTVTFVPVDHPPLDCYGVLVEDPATGASLAMTGDTSYAVPDRSRVALSGADLLLADAIAPASLCDRHPIGGSHHDGDGVPRTFGSKHMTREGALQLADELDADRTRLVHVAHYYPPDEAFEAPLAVDGERFRL